MFLILDKRPTCNLQVPDDTTGCRKARSTYHFLVFVRPDAVGFPEFGPPRSDPLCRYTRSGLLVPWGVAVEFGSRVNSADVVRPVFLLDSRVVPPKFPRSSQFSLMPLCELLRNSFVEPCLWSRWSLGIDSEAFHEPPRSCREPPPALHWFATVSPPRSSWHPLPNFDAQNTGNSCDHRNFKKSIPIV